MIKSFFLLLPIFIFILIACDNTPDYKGIRKEVIEIHDEAMHKSSLMIRNRMKLDTLVSKLDSLKQMNPASDTMQMKTQMKDLINDLNLVDEQMNDWMHAFDPDVSGKTNKEAVEYFEQQLIEVKLIDSLCAMEIERSNNYLQKINNY